MKEATKMQKYPAAASAFAKTLRDTAKRRAEVRALVQAGQWRDAEENPDRAAAYDARVVAKPVSGGPEAIQGNTNDLQAVSYLVEGSQVRRAVAYVEVNSPASSTAGSGFLISPRLFITNYHVIPDVTAARGAQIVFDREATVSGVPSATTSYLLDPDSFALFSDTDHLDYAVLAVGALNAGSAKLAELGYCPLSNSQDRHRLGMNVNIIQHPNGLPKMIAIRNNYLTAETGRTLLYDTDTETGSSGSPVFNDAWDVVALHHWGEPHTETRDDSGKPLPGNVNEGVRISKIYDDLKSRRGELTASAAALLDEALGLASQQTPNNGLVLGPPRPGNDGLESLSNAAPQLQPQKGGFDMSTENELRVVVPVEVVVRVGGVAAAASAAAVAPARTPSLLRGPESVQVDTDYSNRDGYSKTFIPGYDLELPTLDSKLKKQVAPLRAGEADAAEGELKYQHFSIKMHKGKHLAIFTATNIDGATYLNVDRATGYVSDSSEGDRWFKDPRISESFWTGQDFYDEWSVYFDRGHLTRRTDPTWGNDEEAERANADTFHFTNCSPQHFRFNQSAKYWQGAERYVLENGLLAEDDPKKRIIVYQGPIFNSEVDRYAGDTQIPSSFFKVIVWKGKTALKSVGLVVDQLPLLDEKRVSLGAPKDLPSVNVKHWRVAIKQIQSRTGLTFAQKIQDADTIQAVVQPRVGEEAAVPVNSFEDILRGV